MDNQLKYSIYLASAIEHSNTNSQNWKKDVKSDLNYPYIGIYDPIEQECNKTGKSTIDTCNYISGLKRGGYWPRFYAEMRSIWWGNIIPPSGCSKVEIMQTMRNRAIVDGNRIRDFYFFGDIEAVIRSNFIIAYIEKNIKTVGTIREITYAEMFNIPIYLILPDQTKTDANSTLIDMVFTSSGETFYNIKDCLKFIKEKYNIY